MRGLPASGASQWASQRWLVLLNASEPRERQRFSLAHEFKHIIDHRFADLIYAKFPDLDRARIIEQLCDYFAACLLMSELDKLSEQRFRQDTTWTDLR